MWYGDVDKEQMLTSKLLDKSGDIYVRHAASRSLPADVGLGWNPASRLGLKFRGEGTILGNILQYSPILACPVSMATRHQSECASGNAILPSLFPFLPLFS